MSNLARAHINGLGVVKDLEEGVKWTYLAAAVGDDWCKNWIDEATRESFKNEYLEPMMKEGKKRTNQWMQENPDVFISEG